ncbi:hypothetical protein DPMN_175448 [Dreissena polymorpha]|uniref:Uncharacterized protein n=1 Tax=Dreissena polymorpha TaxID=45954 RepID=A0A9D4E9D7_DREPO|nr:hypothetical protein DPMN_175448 [Dreissena polymorpha]
MDAAYRDGPWPFGTASTRTKTRQQHAILTAPKRIVPDSHGRATDPHADPHERDTDKQEPTRTCTTTTRTNTASIRTKPDLSRTDNNLYKSRLIFGDSIIQQITKRRIQEIFRGGAQQGRCDRHMDRQTHRGHEDNGLHTDNVRRCASRQIQPHRNATAIGRRTAGRSSTHQDRALVPQRILQVCIADLLGDGAMCDPKDSGFCPRC